MSYEAICVEREGPTPWLTLDRPEALIAVNEPLVPELRDCLCGLPSDPGTRVVVLRGGGRSGCAGLDRKEPPTGEGVRALLQKRKSDYADR